jgi:hypothetical protein
MSQKRSSISRREFARRAALASAAGTIAPVSSLLAQQEPPTVKNSPLPPSSPKLSPPSQIEADARFDAILRAYGGRFSDAQRIDLHRLCYVIQQPLDHLREYGIQNGDAPALYLKPLVEREKKPAATAPVPAKKPANLRKP